MDSSDLLVLEGVDIQVPSVFVVVLEPHQSMAVKIKRNGVLIEFNLILAICLKNRCFEVTHVNWSLGFKVMCSIFYTTYKIILLTYLVGIEAEL